MEIRDAALSQKDTLSGYEKYHTYVSAVTIGIDSTTDCSVNGRSGYIWVREYGANLGAIQVFNTKVATSPPGVWVKLGYEPRPPYRRVVVDVDQDKLASIATYSGNSYLPLHGSTHEWPDQSPGSDAVSIYPRALTMLRTEVDAGLIVRICPGIYMHDGIIYLYGGSTFDLTSYLPATSYTVRVLLYLNPSDDTVYCMSGVAIPTGITTPSFPLSPDGTIPSAWILLTGGMTTITESLIADARAFLTSNASQSVMDRLYLIESEYDFALSKHIVEG